MNNAKNLTFEDEIKKLIEMKQEGAYWDFKREWHSNKCDLLIDIICFANNLVNKDCYIIIGVDEEHDYTICDVSTNQNRKNTQNLTNFLKDKKFVGDVRPIVTVSSLAYNDKIIDVITVHNSVNTPFYLTEKYQCDKKVIYPFHIYTRVQDTNTAIDSSADINHVECLWRKRFRLDEAPIEKVMNYLKYPNDWLQSPTNNEDAFYYKYSPEYRIVSECDDRKGYEIYHFTQTDSRPHWGKTYIYYHQTVVASFDRLAMDGCRWTAIAPDSHIISVEEYTSPPNKVLYYSYTKNTLTYAMLKFFLGENESDNYGYTRFLAVVLLFENDIERTGFECYVAEHIEEFNSLYNSQEEPILSTYNIADLENYHMDVFEREYKVAKVLKSMLSKFRSD